MPRCGTYFSGPSILFFVWIPFVATVLGDLRTSAGEIPVNSDRRGAYNIRNFGASGEGKLLDTKAIQGAIDACHQNGGGTVFMPPGTYLSGTIRLKSNVALQLDAGATLLGSTDLKDYPEIYPEFRSYTDVNYTDKSLIYAEKAKNVSILGRGTVDGQGGDAAFQHPGGREHYKKRPYMIRIIQCENVSIKDVTIINSPMWVQHYLGCTGVNIDGIHVHSLVNHNNDGIDIDSCNRVRISNCDIISGDDAIVLKSTTPLACRNIVVTNCLLSTRCNAFKLGTESVGGFADITFSNSVIHDTRGSGIALEEVDGGVCERIGISNITMINTRGGIFVRLGNRARPHLAEGPGGSRGTWKMPEGVPQPEVPMGSMSNILISNVQARGVGKTGCSITGLPGHPVRNITLDNIRIQYAGGGTSKDAARVPEEIPEAYPTNRMFGVLPAYGFFVRHVENVRFQNMDVDFEKKDARPAFIFDDIRELDLTGISGKLSEPADVLIKMTNIQNAMIRACRPRHPGKTFLHLHGGKTRRVAILNNDFRDVDKPVECEKDVSDREVFMNSNWIK